MSSSPARKVLLIGWDSADWSLVQPLIDRGEMPALRALIERGASGKLATVLPPVPAIVWNSLATGATADCHGVLGEEQPERQGTAIWDVLSASGLRTHVVGWPFARAAERPNGAFIHTLFATGGSPYPDPWPLPADCVFPERFREIFAELRVHPTDLDGPALLPLVPRAREIDQKRDDSLARIALMLAAASSLHSAATWLLANEPWDFAAVCSHAIGDVSRQFMQYHPPCVPGVDVTQFERFRGVVTGMYRFHDMLLARLVDLAGPEATVMLVSGHGFRSGVSRPAAARQAFEDPVAAHRNYGILAIGGPGVRRDEIVHGASILDIAPTVLSLYGLPRGREMSGRVLEEAWEGTIAAGDEPPAPADTPADAAMAEGLSHQFACFDSTDPCAVTHADRDRYRLAVVYMTTGRPALALPILTALVNEIPEEIGYLRALLQCHLALGNTDSAKQLLVQSFAGHERHAFQYYFQGALLLHEGDRAGALDSFTQAESLDPGADFLPVLIGHCYVGKRLWAEAEAAYRRALKRDPDLPEAYVGMAAVELHRKRYAEAAGSALSALGLRYALPAAHLRLGMALGHLGKYAEAEVALRTSLRLAPGQKSVLRLLAWVLARRAMAPVAAS